MRTKKTLSKNETNILLQLIRFNESLRDLTWLLVKEPPREVLEALLKEKSDDYHKATHFLIKLEAFLRNKEKEILEIAEIEIKVRKEFNDEN